jgi:hypothetical protein
LGAGLLQRHVADEVKEGTRSEEEGPQEGEGKRVEVESDEESEDGYEGIDTNSAEFKFAAQVVAEVANGGSSQTSAGNFLKIMYQYVEENLPEGVDFPKTWYLCEKLGNSKGTHTHTCFLD